MNPYFMIQLIPLFSFIFSLKSIPLYHNISYLGEIIGESINFYNIKISNLTSIRLETLILSENYTSKTRPLIVANYEQFSKESNSSNYLWNKLGLHLDINRTFLNKSKNNEIYIAVFCENCHYELKAVCFNNNFNLFKKETREIRILNEVKNITYNSSNVRMDFYSADGLGALIVTFIMIFVSLVGCHIMMNIYVHNTQLVEQPLKLGKIEI